MLLVDVLAHRPPGSLHTLLPSYHDLANEMGGLFPHLLRGEGTYVYVTFSEVVFLLSCLIHEVYIHIQARVISSQDSFDVGCLEALPNAFGANSPKGSIDVLPAKS